MSESVTRTVSPQSAAIIGVLVATLALTIWRVLGGFSAPLPLSTDEAQYVGWSLNLAPGYYSKPPMIAWVIALSTSICPPPDTAGLVNEGCVRALQPIAFFLAGALALVIAWRIWRDLLTATVAFALLISAPFTSFYARFATTDAWLMLWWAVAALACFRIYETNSALRYWVLFGLSLGLGLLTKYSMVLFLPGAVLWLLWHRQLGGRRPWIGLALAVAVFAPNVWWNAKTGFATVQHHLDISQVASAAQFSFTDRLLSAAEFAAAQWLVFAPLALGAFVLASWRAVRASLAGAKRTPQTEPNVAADLDGDRKTAEQRQRAGNWLLLALSWPVMAAILAQALLSRANANWALPAGFAIMVLAAYYLRGLARTRRGVALIGVALAFNVALEVAFTHGPQLYAQTRFAAQERYNPYLRLTGFREAVAITKSTMRHFPDAMLAADSRSVLAAVAAYGPPQIHTVRAWNPLGLRDNHYRRFQDMADVEAANDVLLLIIANRDEAANEPLRSRLSESFAVIEEIPERLTPGLASLLPGGRTGQRFMLLKVKPPPIGRMTASGNHG